MGLITEMQFRLEYLNRIVSADTLTKINLIYQAEKYSYYTTSMFPVDNRTTKEFKLVKNFLDGVKVERVKFSNGSVKFGYGGVRTDLSDDTQTFSDIVNSQSKSLDTISITDNSSFCKSFLLYHSYFTDSTSSVPSDLSGGMSITTDAKRLRLDSVIEKSCDNSLTVPPYIFTYMAPEGHSTFAPRRLSFGQDHWGL
ncbi:MAG: hypothetical protein IPP73_11585 [Chitinophagaceae bacterium]|nr:hypothetical protein [Chitinophagaceae bacterium]